MSKPDPTKSVMEARKEILERGIVVDDLLSSEPDCPVFGFNLACAYPFPEVAARHYRPIADRLAALDPAVYAYPEWKTHVTIITLVSFALHRRPEPERVAQLQSLIAPVANLIRPLITFPKFELVLHPPMLTPKAAILPITDTTETIPRVRQSVRAALSADRALFSELEHNGLNVPGIIHSTIMRFKGQPANLSKLLADFDSIAADVQPFSMPIPELLLTTETKPYMRGGEIVHRFPLK